MRFYLLAMMILPLYASVAAARNPANSVLKSNLWQSVMPEVGIARLNEIGAKVAVKLKERSNHEAFQRHAAARQRLLAEVEGEVGEVLREEADKYASGGKADYIRRMGALADLSDEQYEALVAGIDALDSDAGALREANEAVGLGPLVGDFILAFFGHIDAKKLAQLLQQPLSNIITTERLGELSALQVLTLFKRATSDEGALGRIIELLALGGGIGSVQLKLGKGEKMLLALSLVSGVATLFEELPVLEQMLNDDLEEVIIVSESLKRNLDQLLVTLEETFGEALDK